MTHQVFIVHIMELQQQMPGGWQVAACTEVHTPSHASRVEQLTSIPAGIRKIQFFMIQLRSSLTGAFFFGSPPKPRAAAGSCDSGYMVVPSGKPLGSRPMTHQALLHVHSFMQPWHVFLHVHWPYREVNHCECALPLAAMSMLSAQRSHEHGKDRTKGKQTATGGMCHGLRLG